MLGVHQCSIFQQLDIQNFFLILSQRAPWSVRVFHIIGMFGRRKGVLETTLGGGGPLDIDRWITLRAVEYLTTPSTAALRPNETRKNAHFAE
jgi:hypothetical protein